VRPAHLLSKHLKKKKMGMGDREEKLRPFRRRGRNGKTRKARNRA